MENKQISITPLTGNYGTKYLERMDLPVIYFDKTVVYLAILIVIKSLTYC